MNTGKVLLGVIAGLATGALVGILFAPAEGSRTRRKIKEQGENYLNELKDKFNEYADSISDNLEHVKGKMSGFADRGKDAMNKAANEL